MKILTISALGILVLLSGCLAPALLLPSQSQLMWALRKPLVGFDPNAVNLFEQPMVKSRMTAMLGTRYETVMQLLRTADEVHQEGPLFYVVSRYTPIPQLADKVGLVWNSDTNQMATLLLKGKAAEVFAESVTAAVEQRAGAVEQAVVDSAEAARSSAKAAVERTAQDAVAQVAPVWPAEIQSWLHPKTMLKRAVDSTVNRVIEGAAGQRIEPGSQSTDQPDQY